MAQIAVKGLCGVHIASIYGEGVECGDEFAGNVAALAYTDNDQLSTWPGSDGVDGSIEGGPGCRVRCIEISK